MGSIPTFRRQLQKSQADPRLLRKILSLSSNEIVFLSVLPLADIPLHDDSHCLDTFTLTTLLTSPQDYARGFYTLRTSVICPWPDLFPQPFHFSPLMLFGKLPKCLSYGLTLAVWPTPLPFRFLNYLICRIGLFTIFCRLKNWPKKKEQWCGLLQNCVGPLPSSNGPPGAAAPQGPSWKILWPSVSIGQNPYCSSTKHKQVA